MNATLGLGAALAGLFLAQPALAAPDLVGSKAPAFTLATDTEATLSLATFAGKHPVVLAFFPKAFTPG